jgi:hypothetical protein
MKENRYLTETERYNIDLDFKQMLFRYKDYLYLHTLINENIELDTTDIGVLTLFIKEKKKEKGITFNYKFIK